MRAIRAKFAAQDEQAGSPDAASAPSATAGRRLGREYVKKIFQLSYSLPAMLPGQLDELLHSMYREASLGPAQLADLERLVRPYLSYVAVDRRVNPREVKRFVNAYTLQALVRPTTCAATPFWLCRRWLSGTSGKASTMPCSRIRTCSPRYSTDTGGTTTASRRRSMDLAPGAGRPGRRAWPATLRCQRSPHRCWYRNPSTRTCRACSRLAALRPGFPRPTKLIGQLRHRLRALPGAAAADKTDKTEIEAIVVEALQTGGEPPRHHIRPGRHLGQQKPAEACTWRCQAHCRPACVGRRPAAIQLMPSTWSMRY